MEGKSTDKHGNLYWIGENGALKLKLANEEKTRTVGNYWNKIFSKVIKNEGQIFQKDRSVGFNYWFIEVLKPVRLSMTYQGKQYAIDAIKAVALAKGRDGGILNFSKKGYELQVMVRFRDCEVIKIRKDGAQAAAGGVR